MPQHLSRRGSGRLRTLTAAGRSAGHRSGVDRGRTWLRTRSSGCSRSSSAPGCSASRSTPCYGWRHRGEGSAGLPHRPPRPLPTGRCRGLARVGDSRSADRAQRRSGRTLPTERVKPARYLSQNEVERLAAEDPPRDRALILVGAYAGLRWGEAAGLRRRNVDPVRSRLRVTGTAVELHGQVTLDHEPKTTRSKRTIQLPGQ